MRVYSSCQKKITVLLLSIAFVSMAGNAQVDSIANVQDTSLVDKVANLADWAVEMLTFKKKNYTFFLLPVASYEERTKLALGVMPIWRFYLEKSKHQENEDTYFRPSNVSSSIIFSLNGMFELEMNSDLYFKKNWYVQNKWLYQSLTSKYYPVGNDVSKDLYSKVDISKIEFLGKVMKGVTKEVFTGITYDVGIFDVENEPQGVLNSNVAGFDGQHVVGVGPTATYDSRDDIVYPRTGSFLNVSYLWYPDELSNFSFSSLSFDARHFVKLGQQSQVLAMQFYLKSASGDVPFYRLPVLGGKNLFRGISQPYKYMDNNSMYLQTAYRTHVWWRLGCEVFAGTGKVFHQWDSSVLDNMHLMAGIGLRVKLLKTEGLSVRFDYGKSSTGDSGLFFTLGEAF